MSVVARQRMAKEQIIARGIINQKVLEAISIIPRELFIPQSLQDFAYEDTALSIDYGQTISQPFIVAFMTEAAKIKSNFKVLEIGTGNGYQTAILAKLCNEVYTIEIIRPLAKQAKKTICNLGIINVHFKIGNGYQGWPEVAPFDAIIVTAAPESIPQSLFEQLEIRGKMIIPLGKNDQELIRITRTGQGFEQEKLLPVNFVPMVKK